MKKKVRSIKSLETAVWNECKRVIRQLYPHKCVSCGKEIEGKSLHTGHYFRKKFIPLRTKYLLDNLRPQCSYCNLRLCGNLENYTVYLIKEGKFDFIKFRELIDFYKHKESTIKEDREYLEDLLTKYKSVL
jgi:hypothetical protein